MHRLFLSFWLLIVFAAAGETFAVTPLNVVQLLPDPARPRLYAISANGKEQGSILVIDSVTHETIKSIPVGKEPTDMDLTENSTELLVMNTTDRSISRINLTSLEVTTTHQLASFSNRNEDFGGHVVDGPGTVLYYVDEQWGPRLRVYDTATGTVLQTFGATTTGEDNDYGLGDIVVNPGKTALFGWAQYGDGAGWGGSFVVRYTIAANGTLSLAGSSNSNYPTPLTREPFDSKALISVDGSRLIIKNRLVDQADLNYFPTTYADNIYSMSPNARIVATSKAILPGASGDVLYTLPVTATVQAILPDYSAMAYFNTTTHAIVWVDLLKTLGTTALGLKVEPADGATVAQPAKLEWFPVTGITRYRVFMGTNRSVIESATTDSPAYLGETSLTSFAITPPANGQTYFWKVVPVGTDGAAIGVGTTRSFVASTLTLSRSSIAAETVEGVSRHLETITLQSASPQAWAATADVPWITIESGTGSTPGNLVAVFNASSLKPGNYVGNITLTSGGVPLVIPVSMKLYAPNFMISEADLELPWVYVVSQESNTSSQTAFLLRINTATNAIESDVPCGRSVTDLAIHYQESRIYLTNWQTGILRAFDRNTFQQVQTYQFTPAGPIGYGEGGLWRVAAGKKGRLILEEADQWIDMRLIDTADGKVISSNSSEYAGDGEADPTGRYYYHSGIGTVTRYDLAADSFVKMTPTATASGSSVVMIPDGSKVCSGSRVLDPQLGLQFTLPEDVSASTLHGDLLFTNSAAYNGSSGVKMATLPATAAVMAVTGNQKKLYQFPAATKTFKVVDLSTIAALPSREITPTIVDGSTVIGTNQALSWSLEPFAVSYKIYFGTSRDAVTNAGITSPEYLGSSATNLWTGTLPPLALNGDYFWRVDVVGFSGTQKGATWSFNVAPLASDPIKLELVQPVGAPVASRTIVISGPAGLAWTAATSTPWLKVSTLSGTTPGACTVEINVAGLAAGTFNGSVSFQAGTDTWVLPVSLELLAVNYTLAEADLEAPFIYAISQPATGTDDRAFMVVIDTLTNGISRVVPVGRSVTDLSVHYQENRIYVSNWQTGKLLALDRTTFKEVQTYSYGAAGGYGTNSGDVYKIAAGRSGRAVIEQEDQWINFFLLDTATGNKLATGYAREGGGVFDPTGRYYYHGENDSSGAELQKYDTGSNLFTKLTSQRVSGFSYYGSRRVLTSGDGSSVFWNGGVFDPDLNVRLQLTNEVVSSTYHGELIFTDKAALNGVNGENLATLPVTTAIHGVSSDQKKLFLFKAGAISVVDLSTIAKISPRGLIPGIADGSAVIGTSQELSWSLEAAALSYNVYFGTSAAAVSGATKTSSEYLGNTTGTRWTGAKPALEFGKTYWWRVDTVGFNSIVTGSTWSFKIPGINVVPGAIELAYPASSPIPVQQLALASPVGGQLAWTASTTTPWITVQSSSGTAPGTLIFSLNSTGLTTGLKEGSVTITAGGDTFSVPVKLRIIALNVTKLVAHPTRPVVYGINTAAAGEGFSHLLEIDAATAVILRSLPIGFAPTDADLDAGSERLYVSNWGYSATRVIDLATWSELPSLSLGTDVYKLEVTPSGRLVTEEQDQWIDLALWNAATGTKFSNTGSVREGDGESDPTGKFYYHCDNNSSGAVVTKFDISGDSFVSVASGPQIGYGSRNLILSRDGSRLFWLGRVMDSNLKSLGQMPAEVYATDSKGTLAIGQNQVWWGDSGTLVGSLAFSSTVATVSANDSHLVRYNATTKTLHSTPLSNFTDLPGPFPRPGQLVDSSPSRLSWSPVAGATSYRLFIAPDATSLSAMTTPVAIVSTTFYDLPSPLAFGQFYSWRVDAVTAAGTVSGKVQSFGVRFPDGPEIPALAGGPEIVSASISNDHLVIGGKSFAQVDGFTPATGATTALQRLSLPGDYGGTNFGSAVAVDAGKVSVGAYALGSTGSAFVYRSAESGYWESSGKLTLPTPGIYEYFGRSMAASGNQMLVGCGYNGKIGRVAAYITEPIADQVQIFTANDGVTADGFGQAIAMEGNEAIITATGPGPSSNRAPALYAFSRSTSTGLWTQTQKIVIPGTSVRGDGGNDVALSGNYLAVNGQASVEIFAKNDSGQWSFSASIKRSSVTGSSNYSFGKALALAGDQLFIGDASATVTGASAGAVFSFRRSGTTWVAGPVITPRPGTYSEFGGILAVHDRWLFAAGTTSPSGRIVGISAAANQTPRFASTIPSQVVAGRAFSTEILAEDADGNSGLTFDLLQGPSWLKLDNGAAGNATLSGMPTGTVNSLDTVQIRVRDTAGAQAFYTYQLTTLAATSLPVLTLEPIGGDTGEGQELVLRAEVTGIGPFKWQWFRDGKLVSGANRPTLTFGEISLEDAGAYSVTVANVVGQDDSSDATVTVHAANASAGDWPTFGGSARHTGFHPARLDGPDFLPAWTSAIAPGHALNRAATGDGKVFVTPKIYFGGSFNATALDLKTGESAWTHAFAEAYSLNPPTYHNGTVYIQRGNHSSDTQLWALSSSTGATAWSSPHSAQWENYESPTVTDAGIWINGGSYGGMYGFSLSGAQLFFRDLAQYDDWTPTVSDGHLFTWVAGIFQEHNPIDGTTIWSVDTGWGWNGWSMNTISAVSGTSAVVTSTTEMVCIDLPTHTIRWRKSGVFTGSPAIAGGLAYGIQDKKVVSYSMADGTAGPVVTVPESIVSGQPLLLMNYLFVAGSANTYVVDRQTSQVVRTLAGGGLLSFGNGYLLAAGTDGTLRAWIANAGLSFTTEVSIVTANARADASSHDLQPLLLNPKHDTDLQWEIVDNSNPSLFSDLWVDQAGLLHIAYAPYVSGSATVVVRVQNATGDSASTSVNIKLPKPPAPSIKVNPSITFNRATGLYEQKVVAKNIAARAIFGFQLTITGLRSGVVLYNGTSVKKGGGIFSYSKPMLPGESVTVILKYYASIRGLIPQPVVRATSGTSAVTAKIANARVLTTGKKPFGLSHCQMGADRAMTLEFATEPGSTYRVQYSADAVHWKICPQLINSAATKIQWIDRGPPFTECAPAAVPTRFYRVERIDP